MKCEHCIHYCGLNAASGMCLNEDSVLFAETVMKEFACSKGVRTVAEKNAEKAKMKANTWIPIYVRPMTEAEKQLCDYRFESMIDSEMPLDGEEVAVRYGELFAFDTWHAATGFETFGYTADAWMRMRA